MDVMPTMRGSPIRGWSSPRRLRSKPVGPQTIDTSRARRRDTKRPNMGQQSLGSATVRGDRSFSVETSEDGGRTWTGCSRWGSERIIGRMAVEWKPLLEVPAAGGSSWLGCGPCGRWVIGRLGDTATVSLSDAPHSVFPLLESPWSEVQPIVSRANQLAGSAMPLDLVLDAALRAGPYWPTRAVEWIEAGYPTGGLGETLAVVVADRRLSQPVRHRIRRLL
jgi:hypothetical protein